jgi:hypothetical protein
VNGADFGPCRPARCRWRHAAIEDGPEHGFAPAALIRLTLYRAAVTDSIRWAGDHYADHGHPSILRNIAAAVAVRGTIWRYRTDLNRAHEAARRGSDLIDTSAGPIEYAAAGAGFPLLSIQAPAAALTSAFPVPGAKLIVFDKGGHLLVGHGPEVRATVRTFLDDIAAPPRTACRPPRNLVSD